MLGRRVARSFAVFTIRYVQVVTSRSADASESTPNLDTLIRESRNSPEQLHSFLKIISQNAMLHPVGPLTIAFSSGGLGTTVYR